MKNRVLKPAEKKRNHRKNDTFNPFKVNLFGDDLSAITNAAGNVAILSAVNDCSINEKIIIGGIISTILVPLLRGASAKSKTHLADSILNGQMSASARRQEAEPVENSEESANTKA
jgi:hypothetical protein